MMGKMTEIIVKMEISSQKNLKDDDKKWQNQKWKLKSESTKFKTKDTRLIYYYVTAN